MAWQVDVRADGGYIIAPTTRTNQGTYRAEGPVRRPAPLPEWLHHELVRTGHAIEPPAKPPLARSQAPGRRSRKPAAAHQILDHLISQVAQCAAAPEGTGFTEKLNRAAYTAGGLVAGGHLELNAVRDELIDAATHARPWQVARNEKTIDDGLAAGSARPLRLEGRP